MRLRLVEFRPALGPTRYRVVRPNPPLQHTALADPTRYGWLVGDHDGLARLGALFAFAARFPHTIVYVPLRHGNPLGEYEEQLRSCGDRIDLVLMHHSLQLPVSRWPELRGRLRAGAPLTVDADEHQWPDPPAEWARRSGRRDFRDWLRPAVVASTLFLIGSRDSFRAAVGEFTYAAGNGPRSRRGARGSPELMSTLTPLLRPESGEHPIEIDISYLGPARPEPAG